MQILNLEKFAGKYRDKNRLQVYFALLVFTFCAYWALNPYGFHLLDGINILLTMLAGSIGGVNFPFNITAGNAELMLLFINSLLPVLVFWLFKKTGADFMAALTTFWFAYACQNWFRFFDVLVYRLPAAVMLCLSLILVMAGLVFSISSAEKSADNFNFQVEDIEY